MPDSVGFIKPKKARSILEEEGYTILSSWGYKLNRGGVDYYLFTVQAEKGEKEIRVYMTGKIGEHLEN